MRVRTGIGELIGQTVAALITSFLAARRRRNRVCPGAKFHCRHVLVVQLGQLFVDVAVVDLARAGLMAAGHVGDVNQADHVDVLVQLLDQLPEAHLLVIDVVEELHLGVIHLPHNLNRLGGRGEDSSADSLRGECTRAEAAPAGRRSAFPPPALRLLSASRCNSGAARRGSAPEPRCRRA